MKDFDVMSLIGLIILTIVVIVFYPFLVFWLGYFSGWLAKIIIGGKLAAAFNVAFHTSYFTAEMLPMIGGALGWISAFFKGTRQVTKEKKNTSKTYWN